MLILSRKHGERIRIVLPNCQLAVTIVSVDGNRVRLGISSPADIAVYREEICARSASKSTVAPWRSRAGVGTEMMIRESATPAASSQLLP